jgi:hypothetical protein
MSFYGANLEGAVVDGYGDEKLDLQGCSTGSYPPYPGRTPGRTHDAQNGSTRCPLRGGVTRVRPTSGSDCVGALCCIPPRVRTCRIGQSR